MCNHLIANGRSERLWHHAGLQSCGLTSTANQQTARASQWVTAASLGDEASCGGQRAVVLILHQCTDKTEQPIHATHRSQPSLHPSLSLNASSNVTAAQARRGCAQAEQRAQVLAQGNWARREAEVDPTTALLFLCVKAWTWSYGSGKPIQVWRCALVHAHLLQMNEGSRHTATRSSFKGVSMMLELGNQLCSQKWEAFTHLFMHRWSRLSPHMLPPVFEPTPPLPRPSKTEDELENDLSP